MQYCMAQSPQSMQRLMDANVVAKSAVHSKFGKPDPIQANLRKRGQQKEKSGFVETGLLEYLFTVWALQLGSAWELLPSLAPL